MSMFPHGHHLYISFFLLRFALKCYLSELFFLWRRKFFHRKLDIYNSKSKAQKIDFCPMKICHFLLFLCLNYKNGHTISIYLLNYMSEYNNMRQFMIILISDMIAAARVYQLKDIVLVIVTIHCVCCIMHTRYI